MEEQLFVRIRGHVQGPYELDKLRALVRRGQLSRMHEVSSDGSVWKQAASFPALFQSPSIEGSASETRTPGKSPDGDVPDVEIIPQSATGRWHYAQNDIQKGPVSFDELKSLVASGNLDGSDLVWTDGMREWAPAQTVPGLVPYSADGTADRSRSSVKLDKEVLRTLAETRPWIKFIAFVMYFYGALGLILGAAAIVMGARWNNPIIIASGGFSVVYGAVSVWGAYLLARYCTDVIKILRESSMRRLDVSLKSMRRFWIFLSIVLIVLLVNALAVAIWFFSIVVVSNEYSLGGLPTGSKPQVLNATLRPSRQSVTTVADESTGGGASAKPLANRRKLEEPFQRYLDANKQEVFKSFHPVGSAKNIVVHEVSPLYKSDSSHRNAADLTGWDVRFTIYWNGPIITDGFTKASCTYDKESERWMNAKILATNGVTNDQFGEFVLNAGTAVLLDQLARQQQQQGY